MAKNASWRTVPISDLYEGLYDGPHATPKPATAGPVFLGIKNVTDDGRLDLDEIRHIAEEDFPTWTRRVSPQPGDLVFTYEATLNRYAMIPEGFRGCLGRRMALIRPNARIVDGRFLLYYFFTREWRDVIASNMLIGSTVDRIPLTSFPTFPVRVPALDVQRRIADVLSRFDALIANNYQRMRILEEMGRLIYREWFVNLRSPGQALDDANGDRTPDGWNRTPLESLITNHIGGGWGKERADSKHTETAWVIRGTDIPELRKGDLTGLPHRYHSAASVRSRSLQADDIVFEVSGGSKGQPVGRTLLVTPELIASFGGETVICASFCKRIRPRHEYAEFLYLSFLEAYESGEIEEFQVQSTGISNFKWADYIRKVHRVVPPDNLMRSFRDVVRPLLSQVATLGRQVAKLRSTRDLLLPNLMSGEIDFSQFGTELDTLTA